MLRRFNQSALVGALFGAVTAVGTLVLLSPVLIGKATAVPFADGTARVDPVFEFGGFELDLPLLLTLGDDVRLFDYVWVLSAVIMTTFWWALGFGIAGFLVALLTRWVPSALDPGASPAGRAWPVLLLGTGTGIVVGILAAQGAITWLGTTTATSVQLGVWRMLMAVGAGGIVLGSAVTATTHLISRPDVVAFESWETAAEFRQATGRAIGYPIIAVITVVVVASALGALFLTLEGTAALIVAGVASAAILGLVSLAAYRPWERRASPRR